MARRLMWCLSAAALLLWAPPVFAQGTVPDIWSAAGVTATVDEADRNIYQFNNTGSVSIRSSVTSGTLDLRFRVQTMPGHDSPTSPGGDCTEMRAVLRDPGAGSRVVLRLMRLGIAGGLEGQLTSLGGIDSDRTPRGSRLNEPLEYAHYRACLNTPSPSPFDFSFYTYYVEAQLIKTAEGGNPGPGLMAVQICHTNEVCEP